LVEENPELPTLLDITFSKLVDALPSIEKLCAIFELFFNCLKIKLSRGDE